MDLVARLRLVSDEVELLENDSRRARERLFRPVTELPEDWDPGGWVGGVNGIVSAGEAAAVVVPSAAAADVLATGSV